MRHVHCLHTPSPRCPPPCPAQTTHALGEGRDWVWSASHASPFKIRKPRAEQVSTAQFAKRAAEARARSPQPLPSPGIYRVAPTGSRHKVDSERHGRWPRAGRTPKTSFSHLFPAPLPQLTSRRASISRFPGSSLRPSPTCARARVLCPGSARGARPEVRRQCSRRRRRRREVRLSPVGRAAPRSAAAIAGQAAGEGRGRPRGVRVEPGMGARVRGSGKLESWGRAGRARLGEKNGEPRGGERRAGEGRLGREGERGGPWKVGASPEGSPGVRGRGISGEGSSVGLKAEGRKGKSGEEREMGGKGGRARAEGGEGGGAGRNLEVCAGRGSYPGG